MHLDAERRDFDAVLGGETLEHGREQIAIGLATAAYGFVRGLTRIIDGRGGEIGDGAARRGA